VFLGTILTDVVSKHMHFTLSAMFQATLASYTAAAETSPLLMLILIPQDQLQKPRQEDFPIFSYYGYYLPM